MAKEPRPKPQVPKPPPPEDHPVTVVCDAGHEIPITIDKQDMPRFDHMPDDALFHFVCPTCGETCELDKKEIKDKKGDKTKKAKKGTPTIAGEPTSCPDMPPPVP